MVGGRRQFLLSDYVVVEIANALSRVPFRRAAIQIITLIQTSTNIRVVEVDKEIFGEAWKLYTERLDKEWSFTDCTSFVVMNRLSLADGLTSEWFAFQDLRLMGSANGQGNVRIAQLRKSE